MTHSIRSVLAAATVLATATSAQALPITDVFTPAGSPITLTTGNPYVYEHNLLDDGFDPLSDVLTSVTLSLNVSGPGGQPLTITLEGSNELFNDQLNTLIGAQPLSISLSFLQTDGLLSVELTKGGGAGSTFSFMSSTLVANGTSGTTNPGGSIPEPAAAALLGIGLITAGRRFRRRSAV